MEINIQVKSQNRIPTAFPYFLDVDETNGAKTPLCGDINPKNENITTNYSVSNISLIAFVP